MADDETTPGPEAAENTQPATETEVKKKAVHRAPRPKNATAKRKHVHHEAAAPHREAPESRGGDDKIMGVGIKSLVVGAAIVLAAIFVITYATNQNAGVAGVTTTTIQKDPAKANTAEKGDIATLDYTGRFENGTIFDSSVKEVAQEGGFYNPLRTYEPMTFTIGYGGLIKGFEEAVLGMKAGEEKKITLPPENAYGYPKEELVQTIERYQKSPIIQNVSLVKFKEDIGKDPYPGMEFQLENRTQYEVAWPMQVLEVYNDTVKILYKPNKNVSINTVFGEATIYGTPDEIIIKVSPEPGQRILTLAGPATVLEVNEENVTMDFNHELAGKNLKFDIKLRGIVKQH